MHDEITIMKCKNGYVVRLPRPPDSSWSEYGEVLKDAIRVNQSDPLLEKLQKEEKEIVEEEENVIMESSNVFVFFTFDEVIKFLVTLNLT